MSRSLKSLMFVSCFFALSFIFTDYNQLEATHGRWGAYNDERGAWGGNGGWWGDSRSDWYGDYGTREEHHHYGNYSNAYQPGYGYDRNDYYYNNNYPYYGQYYGDSVDGAGLYFNIR